ncbi:MAG: DUF721 domain-containing protein [Hyphomicrobiales bacterium]
MKKTTKKPYGGAVSIGRLAEAITAPIFSHHGMGHGEIAHAWAEIVGPELARFSQPDRLTRPRGDTGATLIVRAQGPRTIEVHYASQQIIEGVNALYGYRMLDRIKVVAAPPGKPALTTAPTAKRPTRNRNHAATPPTSFPGIGSPALGTALSRLELGLTGREDRAEQSGYPHSDID